MKATRFIKLFVVATVGFVVLAVGFLFYAWNQDQNREVDQVKESTNDVNIAAGANNTAEITGSKNVEIEKTSLKTAILVSKKEM